MLAAKSIACSKPVGGGQSGVHLAKVFEQLGIAAAMQAKAKYGAGGAAGLAGLVVLRGEADIGIQQMAELMAVDGIDMVGPLPPEIQMVTPFVAGIPANASHAEAGRAVIDLLDHAGSQARAQSEGLGASLNLPAVVGPVQQRLALPRPAGDVARLAVASAPGARGGGSLSSA